MDLSRSTVTFPPFIYSKDGENTEKCCSQPYTKWHLHFRNLPEASFSYILKTNILMFRCKCEQPGRQGSAPDRSLLESPIRHPGVVSKLRPVDKGDVKGRIGFRKYIKTLEMV